MYLFTFTYYVSCINLYCVFIRVVLFVCVFVRKISLNTFHLKDRESCIGWLQLSQVFQEAIRASMEITLAPSQASGRRPEPCCICFWPLHSILLWSTKRHIIFTMSYLYSSPLWTPNKSDLKIVHNFNCILLNWYVKKAFDEGQLLLLTTPGIKEKRNVVFVDAPKNNSYWTGRYGSPLCLWPLVRLSSEPVFGNNNSKDYEL